MAEQNEIKNAVLCDLRNGAIQPFQIAERLRMMGVASFEVKRLNKEIWESFQKEHPCY